MKSFSNKILLLAPSLGVHGGIEAVAIGIANECVDNDTELKVLFRLRKDCTESVDFKALIGSYPVLIVRKNLFVLLREIARCDVIHVLYPFWWALLPALILRKKIVVSVINQKSPHKSRWILALEKWLFLKAQKVLVISRFVARTWSIAIDEVKSHVIPCITQISARVIPTEQRRGFLIVARLIPEKGVPELIQAYQMANIDHALNPLVIVGTGPLLCNLKDHIVDKHRSHIKFTGYVTEVEKISLLSNARWNVAPQTFPEDLGMTPIEAALCNVPSIVSNIGGLPEAAGPRAILVEAGNIAELTDALERAASMGSEEYGERCRLNQEYLKHYLKPLSYYPHCYRELLNPKKETDLH